MTGVQTCALPICFPVTIPSLTSSQNQISNIKNQKSFPSRPWREAKPKSHPATAGSATLAKDFSDPKKDPYSPWRPLRESSAFSLTEVVIAMGVAAVAFTSIIALFPLGLGMSKESYEATQAALIAQTILADLKDALNTGSVSKQALKLISKTGNSETFDSINYTTIDLYNNTSQTF